MPICDVSPKLVELLSNSAFSGGPVTEFLRAICNCNPRIAEMRFRTYVPSPGLGERLKTCSAIVPEYLAVAEKVASGYGSSVWDSLAGIVMREGRPLSCDVFSEALVHPHSELEKAFVLKRQEIMDSGIDSIKQHVRDNECLAVCSEVRVLGGYAAHLPMLDFACGRSEANQAAIVTMLNLLGQIGVIANSGNSYHFLGVALLTGDEWVRFMGQGLLVAPFTDVRFIGHRLIDGECLLRVFAASRNPRVPLVEASVCPAQ